MDMDIEKDLEQIWDWNKSVPEAIDRCVHELVQERVEADPAAPAVCAWDGELTYGELDRLAAGVAGRLLDLGVGPDTDTIIPLCFEKSVWTTVAMLGVLKAGAALALVDPDQPEHRLRTIVEQTRADIIVSSPSKRAISSRLVPRVVTLSPDFPAALDGLPAPRLRLPAPSAASYIAFTSGSTGTPKGAVITHRNLASALRHQQEGMRLAAGSRVYDFASYSFDAAVGTVFATLVGGGCICVPREDERRDNLIRSIVSLDANVIDLTPSVAALLSPERVPCLRTLILGGEAIQVADVARWWGRVDVMSLYGPCECTPTTTINWGAPSPEEAIHLGKVVGMVPWIVDPEDHNALLPIGHAGELLLEGPPVGRGYLHDPERTAAAFIEDPVWLLKGAPGRAGRRGRLYKTGDLVRYRPDGGLVFVGRKDTQVKIRGQRVELSEVEHVLRGHVGVDEAIAVLQKKDDDAQEQWIAAFVTVRDHGTGFGATDLVELPDKTNNLDSPTNNIPLRTRQHLADEGQVDKLLNGPMNPTSKLDCSNGLPEMGDAELILVNLPSRGLDDGAGLGESTGVVEFVTQMIRSIPELHDKVALLNAVTADLNPLGRAISPGLVALNSIVQYLPSQAYLFSVIEKLLQSDQVKTLFVGDIRSNTLNRESQAMRALNMAGEDAGKDEVQRIIDNIDQAESELLVDPALFTTLVDRLPDLVGHVEIYLESTQPENGHSPIRYAAVIHTKASDAAQRGVREINQHQWADFKDQGLDPGSLRGLLKDRDPSAIIAVSNIPHRESVFGRYLVRSLEHHDAEHPTQGSWISAALEQAREHPSLSVGDVKALATQAGCRVRISCARQCSRYGGLDAVFYPPREADDGEGVLFAFPTEDCRGRPYDSFSNRPIRQRLRREIQDQLLEVLRSKLPSYMIPQTVRVLDKMPLNNNCKIDRRALARKFQRYQLKNKSAAHPAETVSGAESQMRQIWGAVLHLEAETIGPDDEFFDLGGNSIAAMKVVQAAREAGLELTVQTLFRHSKLRDTAERARRPPQHTPISD
ncbi:acetyl-CoA synthetase-like protein [Xylaria palmicola]|nr:acetyl-CoA synthetase-like protein [Xylaria palmicola]